MSGYGERDFEILIYIFFFFDLYVFVFFEGKFVFYKNKFIGYVKEIRMFCVCLV